MPLRTRRTWRRPPPPFPPAGIGHNQGPPLDAWSAHCWRKAKTRAWSRAPAEVVRRRARRAQELGLSYRDYTAVILDRGTHPQALVFVLGTAVSAARVSDRLAAIVDCRILVCAPKALRAEIPGLTAATWLDQAPPPEALRARLAEQGLNPSAAVMIGETERDRDCAERAGLGRFVWAGDYFGGL